MKYTMIYPKAQPGDIVDGRQRITCPIPCSQCGEDASFVDINLGVPLCSPECYAEELEQMETMIGNLKKAVQKGLNG